MSITFLTYLSYFPRIWHDSKAFSALPQFLVWKNKIILFLFVFGLDADLALSQLLVVQCEGGLRLVQSFHASSNLFNLHDDFMTRFMDEYSEAHIR